MNGTKIAAGGSTGGAAAAAIVYLLSRLNVSLTSEDGALIALTLAAVGAFVVHNGIAGAFKLIWHGSPSPKAEDGLTLLETLIVLVIIVLFLLALGWRL